MSVTKITVTGDGESIKTAWGKVNDFIDDYEGSSGITWSVITSATNAAKGNGYICDTETTAAFTLTLPGSPSVGDTVAVTDATGYFATNNLTIGRNSLKIMGLEEDMTVSVDNVYFGLVYQGATYGWRLSL